MKKVLMITNNFPPNKSIGRVRILKFAKYLPLFGWKPMILTSTTSYLWEKDTSLMDEIPCYTDVHRAFHPLSVSVILRSLKKILKKQRSSNNDIFASSECKQSEIKKSLVKLVEFYERLLRRYILIPDDDIIWLPFALFKGLKVIRKEKIDVIYTSAPSYTCFLIGYFLKLLSKKPWVVDYRDLWGGSPYYLWSNKYRIKIETLLEKHCIGRADNVITVSEPMIKHLQHRIFNLNSEQFHSIPNGFDSEDYINLRSKFSNHKFTITYTGSLFKERTPIFFIRALTQLMKEKIEIKNKLMLKFIGPVDEHHKHEIKLCMGPYGFDKIVHFLDYLPRKEVLKEQINSDVLLFIIAHARNDEGVLTLKLFEYLRAGRPILGLVSGGSARDIIARTRTGTIVDPEDVNGIKKAIWKLYQKYEKGELRIDADWDIIQLYDRKVLTERVARIFDSLFKDKIKK